LPDGTTGMISETLYDVTDARAAEIREERRVAIRAGTFVAPSRETVKEYFDRWFESNKTRLASGTLDRYRALCKRQLYPRIGALPFTAEKLSSTRLRSLYDELQEKGGVKGGPLSGRTVEQVHAIIHVVCETAVFENVLPHNPADKVTKPKAKKATVKTLEPAAVRALFEAFAARENLRRFYVPTLLGGILGLRRGEMLGLRWKDVRFDKKTLIVEQSLESIPLPDPAPGVKSPRPNVRLAFKRPKNENTRTIDIPDFVLQALRDHQLEQKKARLAAGRWFMNEDRAILNPDGKTPWNPDDDRLVVCALDGRPWHPESFTPRFSSAAKMVGFPSVTFHSLRHSAISTLIATGAHVKTAQEFAGHHCEFHPRSLRTRCRNAPA
jgi:integrase